MPEIDERVDNIEGWEWGVNQELLQLKKEMIGRVFDKMKEKNKGDIFLHVWKKLVEDYLLDEWASDDKVGDFFIWMGITFLSSSSSQLKDFRERIKNSNTKEELDALERSIIENLDNPPTDQESWWGTSSAVQVLTGAS